MSLQAHFFRWVLRIAPRGEISQRTLAERRREASFGAGLIRPPRAMEISALSVAGMEARWIAAPQVEAHRVLLYLHGGGWVFGWMGFYDSFVTRLAQASKSRVLGIDYHLAPEFPYPAALEDCLSAYRFLLAQGTPAGRIVIVGDSAGGNLTLVTLLALKRAGLQLPAAGVCLCPVTDLAADRSASLIDVEKDVVLDPASMKFFRDSYLGGKDPRDPLISPLNADLAGLPPLLIQAGGDEILLSDSQALAARAVQAGVKATLQVYPGMWHVWQLFTPYLPEAKQAVEEISRFIQSRT